MSVEQRKCVLEWYECVVLDSFFCSKSKELYLNSKQFYLKLNTMESKLLRYLVVDSINFAIA